MENENNVRFYVLFFWVNKKETIMINFTSHIGFLIKFNTFVFIKSLRCSVKDGNEYFCHTLGLFQLLKIKINTFNIH